jgi:ankyrin repeat protein/GTPase SAR1 family protein
MRGDIDVADKLIRMGANPNYSNAEGTIKPSLYYASRYGHFHLVQRLIERHKCDVHYKTPRGTTLLHLACLHGHDDIVKYLTSPPNRLDPSAKNRLGSTPLHLSCVGGHPLIVQYLIENLHCDPQSSGELEETPLHTACTAGHLGIMKYLIEVQKCNACKPTHMGETPLHLACQHGHKDIVVYLVAERGCNILAKDCFQNTPLHSAAQQNHYDIVRYLVLEKGCDPHVYNHDKCTPLHLACKYNRIEVVKVLLEEAKIVPSIKGPDGKTPIQVAYGNEVVKLLIRHGADPSEAQVNIYPDVPPQDLQDTIIRILVVGDSSSGKSTLVEALKTPPKNFLNISRITGKITDVQPYTAGIIPHEIKNSQEFGHVLLFDFAGQREYYHSHSVVIDSVCVSAPIFVVVVDLSKGEEHIKLRLHFWVQFIENNRPTFASNPHIVVVGSHYDILSSANNDSSYKHRVLENIRRFSRDIIKNTKLTFDGFFHLNCQKLATHNELRQVLAKSCKSLRTHITDDTLCHAFGVYLFSMFPGRIMCTVKEVLDVVKRTDAAFPIDIDKLCKLCESLGNKVNIMFIKNIHNIRESTIILEVSTLLSRIQGVMFAPEGFKEHKLKSKNGIVTFSRLRKVFNELDPRVIAQCMERLEFCQEIQDRTVLDFIKGQNQFPDSPEVECDGLFPDEYYFFPCLIDCNHPTRIWIQDMASDPSLRRFSYYSGWCLQINQEMTVFPSRFLHALLLRLAFNFAVVSEESSTPCSLLNRECNLWKSGIHWFSLSGTETYVELREDGQVLVLVMRCLKEHEVECVKLRAAVIKTILDTKADFAPLIQANEGLLDPSYLHQYPLPSVKKCEIPFYNITMVLRPLIEKLTSAFDISHQNFITLSKLLYWDPYMNLGKEILDDLFNPALQSSQITDEFIDKYSENMDKWDLVAIKVFQFDRSTIANIAQTTNNQPIQACKHVLHQMLYRDRMTFGRLKTLFGSFSIFNGRDIMVSMSWY